MDIIYTSLHQIDHTLDDVSEIDISDKSEDLKINATTSKEVIFILE